MLNARLLFHAASARGEVCGLLITHMIKRVLGGCDKVCNEFSHHSQKRCVCVLKLQTLPLDSVQSSK